MPFPPGCFAVQQTDTVAKVNTPQNIATAQTLEGVEAQILQNKADLNAAVAANQQAGTSQAVANQAVVDKLLALSITTKAAAVQTPVVVDANGNVASSAGAATTAKNSTSTKGSKGNKASKNNKRERTLLRWAERYVLPNTDFSDGDSS
jgi:hypothetical protein